MASNKDFIPQKDIDSILATDKAVIKLDNSTLELIKTVEKLSEILRKEGTTLTELNEAQKKVDETAKKAIELDKKQEEAIIALDKQRQKSITAIEKSGKATLKSAGREGIYFKELKKNETQLKKQKVAEEKKAAATKKAGLATTKAIGRESQYFKQLRQTAAQTRRNATSSRNYARALRSVGSQLFGALGISAGLFGFVRVMGSAIQTSIKFEKQTATLAGVLDVQKTEVKALTAQAIELGGTYPTLASEVLGLQTAYARLGFTQQDILDLTEDTIVGTFALNSGLEETALLVGAVVKAYDDLEATDAGEIIDKLTKSTQKSSLNFEGLKVALPKVAGAANALNIPLSKTLGILGTAVDATQDFSIAGTSTRRIMLSNAKAGRTLSESLDIIEKSTNKVKTAQELFGDRAAVVGLALANNREKTEELTRAINESAGVAERTASKQLNTLKGSIDSVASSWEKFTLKVNQSNGELKDFLDNVAGAINSLTDVDLQVAGTSVGLFAARLFGFGDEAVEKSKKDIKTFYSRLQKLSIEEIEKRIPEQERLIEEFRKDGDKFAVRREEGRRNAMNEQLRILSEAANKELEIKKNNADELKKLIAEEFKEEEEFRSKIALINATDLEKHKIFLEKKISEFQSKGIDQVLIAQWVSEQEIKFAKDSIDKNLKAYKTDIKERQKIAAEALKEEFTLGEDEEVPDIADDPLIQMAAERMRFVINAAEQAGDAVSNQGEIELQELEELHRNKLISDEDYEAAKTDITQEGADKRKEIIQLGAIAAAEIGNLFLEGRMDQLNVESQQLSDLKAHELEVSGTTAAERDKINDKFAKKEAVLKNKQAQQAKQTALFNGAINFASALIAALTIPPPASFIAEAFTAALAGVQLAAIAAKPVPKFFKGTDNAPAGNLIAGDRGRELIDKDGRLMLVNEPTILSGLQGAKIYTNKETEKIISSSNTGYDSSDLRELIKGNKDVVKAINNIPKPKYDRDNRTITERNGKYFKTYVNAKISGY